MSINHIIFLCKNGEHEWRRATISARGFNLLRLKTVSESFLTTDHDPGVENEIYNTVFETFAFSRLIQRFSAAFTK